MWVYFCHIIYMCVYIYLNLEKKIKKLVKGVYTSHPVSSITNNHSLVWDIGHN